MWLILQWTTTQLSTCHTQQIEKETVKKAVVCAVLCGGDCHWLNPCPGTMHSQSTLTQLASTRTVGAPKDSCGYAPGMWVQQEGLLFLSNASTQS